MTKLSIEDLAAELIRKIEAGDIGNEQGKMPSERELLAIYPVSRYTLRQALNKLSKIPDARPRLVYSLSKQPKTGH